MKSRFNIETIFAGFMTLLSALFLHFALKMETGRITEPGAGFVPALIGGSGLIVSLVLFINSYKNSQQSDSVNISRDGIMRFLGYLITMTVFIPLLKFAGTIIALFMMVLALTKISGSKGWIYPVILAVLCSVGIYAIFCLALNVPLPKGVFRL